MSMQPSIQSAFLPQIATPEAPTEPGTLKSKESEALASSPIASSPITSSPITPGLILSRLPTPLRSHQFPIVLQQLAEALKDLPSQATEAELRQLVQWGLSQSYSDELTPMQKMELLNLVWPVQQWVWS